MAAVSPAMIALQNIITKNPLLYVDREDLRGSFIIARRELNANIRSARMIILTLLLALIVVTISWLFGSTMGTWIAQVSSDLKNQPYGPDVLLATVAFFMGISCAFFSLFFAYDDISREKTSRSLQFLLLKPIDDRAVMLGKFLGTFSTVAIPVVAVTIVSVLIIWYTSGQSPTVLGTLGFLLCIFLVIGICISFEHSLSMVFKTSTSSLIAGLASMLVMTSFWQLIVGAIALATKNMNPAFMEKTALFNPFPAMGNCAYIYAVTLFTGGEELTAIPSWLPLLALFLWFLLFLGLSIFSFKRMVRKL